MKKSNSYLICFLLTLALPCIGDQLPDCNSVSACLALAPVSTERVYGITAENMRIAERIAGLGREALPELLEAMNTDNYHAREIIDYAVAKMEDLVPEDLSLVIKIMRADPHYSPGGGGSSYCAIGRIGTEEAIGFLAAELVAANSSDNQIGFAFKQLGEKGSPFLLDALRCKHGCDPTQLRGIAGVFRYIRQEARSATEGLLEIAKNKELPEQARLVAIESLGFVAASAEGVDKTLSALAREDENLIQPVRTVLVQLKSPLALEYLLDGSLSDSSSGQTLPIGELMALGPVAKVAGPKLVALLKHENWDTRVNAAMALGSLEYKEAVSELIAVLSNQSDWELVHAAIVSLIKLKDPLALDGLRRVKETHWYPPVARSAACGIEVIRGERDGCAGIEPGIFEAVDSGGIWEDVENCKKTPYPGIEEPENVKKYGNESSRYELKEFEYTVTYCDWPDEFYESESADELIDHIPCTVQTFPQYPEVAAKVADGWLTGRDAGEFGGEMMFFPDQGKPYEILKENVLDIYVLEDAVIALTGLAHLGWNEGMIYKLQKQPSGEWAAIPFSRLPGAPISSYRISDSEILVDTHGGTVIADDSGGLKMAVCSH